MPTPHSITLFWCVLPERVLPPTQQNVTPYSLPAFVLRCIAWHFRQESEKLSEQLTSVKQQVSGLEQQITHLQEELSIAQVCQARVCSMPLVMRALYVYIYGSRTYLWTHSVLLDSEMLRVVLLGSGVAAITI